jgi:hypothetical protein
LKGLNKLFKLFGFSIFKSKETQFFIDVVQTTLKNRLKNDANGGNVRNDLVLILLNFLSLSLLRRSNELKCLALGSLFIGSGFVKFLNFAELILFLKMFLRGGLTQSSQTIGSLLIPPG